MSLIESQTTRIPIPISVEEKLAVTFRFLATDETFRKLMYRFRLISKFILWLNLSHKFWVQFVPFWKMRIEDSSQEDWIELEDQTYKKWQFPNAYTAADGKHTARFYPFRSGSNIYNYNGFFSIVLMTLVDSDFKFIHVDLVCQGRISDGGVFRNSFFHEKMFTNPKD